MKFGPQDLAKRVHAILSNPNHPGVPSVCVPCVVVAFDFDPYSTRMTLVADDRRTWVVLQEYFDRVHLAEDCPERSSSGRRVEDRYRVSPANPMGAKVRKPVKFEPRPCTWPTKGTDCPNEGIHRWVPERKPSEQGMSIAPIDLCDPHHKEAERLVRDVPPKEKP